MKKGRPNRVRRREAGIALLISIFILLLISVVAIALIISSGTESALAGNYRSSTAVYNAALSGLEEARSRLLAKNPSSFSNTAPPGFVPSPGNTMAIGSISYVLNPSPDPAFGENFGNLLTLPRYQDTEYDNEFGAGKLAAANTAGTVQTTRSVWNTGPLNAVNGTMGGPSYKWVRINPVSEVSLNLNVSPFTDPNDAVTPIFYNGTQLNVSNSGQQVFEITSLAVLPNGSQKLLQYLATPLSLNLSFPAALTLDGNNVQFNATNANSFWVKGADQGAAGSCTPGAPPVTAVGYTNNGDSSQSNIVSAIPSASPNLRTHYTNYSSPTPNVSLVTVSPNLQTIAGLNALVQTITQNADAVVNGPATQSDLINIMPAGMSATNPMTVVVNGNFTINSWHSTGYGLLLVTGDFTYDPDANWNGIILVIGTGKMDTHQGGGGLIQGAVFLANTNGLPVGSPLGSPWFDYTTSAGGDGIAYSNCWIQASIPVTSYKILSFHEIAQ